MATKPITEMVGPGAIARLHLGILRVAAAIARRFGIKGLGRFVGLVGRATPHDDFAVLRLDENVRLKVFLRDAYWIAPLLRDRAYEPDIGDVLDQIDWNDAAFIDCGANLGYWSAVVASRVECPGRVVAIEASSRMYEQLHANARLNGGRFEAVHAAVWHTPGVTIRFAADLDRHSWGSADPEVSSRLIEAGFENESVPTVTIDTILSDRITGEPDLVVVKLDVEGAEVAALQGAALALAGNSLLIYEDHGRDRASEVTRAVLELGMSIYHGDGRGLQGIEELEQIRNLKPDSTTAYNFFACNKGTLVHRYLLGRHVPNRP